MRKYKAFVFFLLAIALMSVLVYYFAIDDASKRGLHDQLRLHATDDVVLITLIGYDGQKVMFEKHESGTWLSDDSVRIDALLVKDLLNALKRIQVRRPVSIENRQQVNDDLMMHGVRVKIHAGRHWVNLPGNIRLFARKKMIYEALIGYDIDAFDDIVISHGKGSIPYEIYLPSHNGHFSRFLSLNLDYWRDPVVVSLLPSEISRIAVRFKANVSESFDLKLFADTFLFKDHAGNLIDGALLNKPKLARFIHAFRELSYEQLITTKSGQIPDDIISDKPFMRITIEDNKGCTVELSYHHREAPNDATLVSEFSEYDPNRFYIKTMHGDFALAQYYVFQPTMRTLSYFLENPE